MMNVDKLDTVTVSVDFFEAAFTLQEQNAALLELLRWLAHEASLADEFTYTKKMSEVDEAIRKAKERT